MINRGNVVKSLLEHRARQGPSHKRRPVRLAELVGVLVLGLALSSVGLATGSASAPDLERSNEASAMRWARLGEAYEADRAEAAAASMTDRFWALAVYYGVDTATLVARGGADAERWFKQGEAYVTTRAEAAATAMTSRYKALADYCNGQPETSQPLLCSADYGLWLSGP